MTSRATILLAVAVIAFFLWLNLAMFRLLDQTIDAIATVRAQSAISMTAGKIQYKCYVERRIR